MINSTQYAGQSLTTLVLRPMSHNGRFRCDACQMTLLIVDKVKGIDLIYS